MLEDYKFYRKSCGIHSIEWAINFRKLCKRKFGSKVNVIFRGRGERFIQFDISSWRRYNRDLPLKFAGKYAVYLTLRK